MKTSDSRSGSPPCGPGCSTFKAGLAVLFVLSGLNASMALGGQDPANRPPQGRRATPVKVLRYCQRLIEKYDLDGDGALNQSEWDKMQGTPRLADRNRDGSITLTELADRVAQYGLRRRIRLMPALSEGRVVLPSLLNPPAGLDLSNRPDGQANDAQEGGSAGERRAAAGAKPAPKGRRELKFFVPRGQLPAGVPDWFLGRDANGDGQLSMAEYAPKGTKSALAEFTRFDANRDGVITPSEYLRGPQRAQKPEEEVTEEGTEGEAVEAAGEGETGEGAAEESGAKASQQGPRTTARTKRTRTKPQATVTKKPSDRSPRSPARRSRAVGKS